MKMAWLGLNLQKTQLLSNLKKNWPKIAQKVFFK